MNTWTASGIAARTWRAPCTSISSTTGTPARDPLARAPSAASRSCARRSRRARRTRRPATRRSNSSRGEEVVVDAVLLARAGSARRRRHRQLELRQALHQPADQRSLADARGPGDDEHARHGRHPSAAPAVGNVPRALQRWSSEIELGALALGEPADRLARRDPAVGEDLVDLHAPVLRDREQHVEHLRRLHVLRRVEQQRVDRAPAGLQVALELRALDADLVRSRECIHALVQRSLGRGRGGLEDVVLGRRAPWAASLHTSGGRSSERPRIHLNLDLRSRYVEAAGRCHVVFAGVF